MINTFISSVTVRNNNTSSKLRGFILWWQIRVSQISAVSNRLCRETTIPVVVLCISGKLRRPYRPVNSLMKKAPDELVCFEHHNTDISMVIMTAFVLFLKVAFYMWYLTFYREKKKRIFSVFFCFISDLDTFCNSGIRSKIDLYYYSSEHHWF